MEGLDTRGAIMTMAQGLIRNDARVSRAFKAMCARGLAASDAEVEIALALVCCIWETSRGMADRFAQVCDGLANGMTADQLFPDSIQDSRQSPRAYGPLGAKAG